MKAAPNLGIIKIISAPSRFLLISILGSNVFIFLLVHFLRITRQRKYHALTSTKLCIYSACYGSYDRFMPPPKQSLDCDIIYFTDIKPEECQDVYCYCYPPLSNDPRYSAKFFKICPNLIQELQDYSITVWIDSSCNVTSKYFLELLLMCTSGSIVMKKHPDRTTIIDEANYSTGMKKYFGCTLVSQAKHYIQKGLVDNHLWHCAMIKRESCKDAYNFNALWWKEMEISLQDQISAPYAEYSADVKIQPFPRYLNFLNLFHYDLSHRQHEYSR